MNKIEFREVPISSNYGNVLRKVFFVEENGKSKMIKEFNNLDEDLKDDIKVLISKMATHKHYESDKIKWNLRGYNYGEIRPFPHRFFFFQKCGDNLIFFDYYLNKKKDSIKDEFYKRRKNMKKNSRNTLQDINDFFGSPPTSNQKAWGIINDFYDLALTYMKESKPKEITKAELARRLGKSRSAISQMFNKTPNLTIKKMCEIADAIGFDFNLYSDEVFPKEEKVKYVYVVQHRAVDKWDDNFTCDKVLAGHVKNPNDTITYYGGFYGN